MASLRDHLAERMQKYDQWLLQWSETADPQPTTVD
jgi:hypothetical protein